MAIKLKSSSITYISFVFHSGSSLHRLPVAAHTVLHRAGAKASRFADTDTDRAAADGSPAYGTPL